MKLFTIAVSGLLVQLTILSAGAQPADFAHDVVPLLKKHCVACHGGREAKGSFSLNTRELLIDSGHLVSGKPDESHLWMLVNSDDPEVQMPPKDKPRLNAAERKLLRDWIVAGVPWDDGFSFAPTAFEPPLHPRRPELPPVIDGRSNPIDRILDQDLQQHGIPRPGPIDDAAFLRRAWIDLTGLLPSPEQLQAFLADPASDKRERVIVELLADDIAYADHWLTFFNDLLRNDYSGTGFITSGRTQISTWLYDALLKNMPYNQLARELIAPSSPASQGYINGIRWRGEVSAGQTVEIQFAQSISQSFLGINMKCASCHDSFIDRWKLEEAYGLAAIYSSRPLEIHRCDKPIGKQAEARWLFPELGQVDAAAPKEERLRQLAALMTHPDNGRFTRTIVNRLWYKLMGRGIVHPLDAMQSEPWNADLLDYLAVHLSDNQYDLKSVLRLIATSQAWQSRTTVRSGDTGPYVFQGPVSRRLTAEQFMDSVWQITQAAPKTIDAPVFRAKVDEAEVAQLQLQAQWIWGDSAMPGKVPAAGESISLRKTVTLDDTVERGGAVLTCDNSFVLYINGREVHRSDDWTKPQAVALHTLLKQGENQFVVVATNAGDQPNVAGLFFEARLRLKNGSEVSIVSDSSWEWNPQLPKDREGRLGAITGDWAPATVVTPVNSWTRTITAQGRNLLAQAVSGEMPMVRASLVKSDFLMRSLGRPLREQIVSMRPSELTTLEAIDLANGNTLAASLAHGARQLAERPWANTDELIRYVFQFAFTREPTLPEMDIVRAGLGDKPGTEAIEDFLWAVFMMPEFLLIR